ncbi:TPM domain-containing protein [Cognatishimia maritima]|uniref:TPM domain-containing protein n=1 Tax=Cognatishimia maritima TaxID=870908 RepID=A0A1M5PCJ5_9RHOB|nr:TPM domain-containing protein [Cognatishimia maritima]SHG99466.1 uncharacterized protein SAMN04488044_1779 [Cognatishimia maritima]
MRYLLIGILWLTATVAWAQTYPDYTEPYVNDFASLLSVEEEEVIREKLKELRTETDIEFTVVIIDRMSDYGHDGAIEPFATGLFNYWGVGDAARNDGVMFLVSRLDRVMRIEVGAGYGDSKDAAMAAIIDDKIVPLFRDDEYEKGINRGVDAIIHEVGGSWPGEFNASFFEKLLNRLSFGLGVIGDWIAVFYAFVAGLGYRLFRRWKRNKPRICPIDGTKMQRVGELEDDTYLKDGQKLEERLKSVDYDVWLCDQCDHRTIESYKSWFSGFGACRTCNFRTLEGESTILEHATTSSTGLKRVDYHCKHCDDRYHTHVTIPKKLKSSSSSSSGSFGGGSSSGGGASGSW